MSFLVIPIKMLRGQLNFKFARDSLFSERGGSVPSIVIFGIRVTWRKWRSLI